MKFTGATVHGVPDGYRASARGGTLLVARDDAHDALAGALCSGTLHAWASHQPDACAFEGRTVAWATRLPSAGGIVVRHSRHGGLLRGITRDLFLAPSRAPRELRVALRLRAALVRTPDVIGYATYSAPGPFCRADVVTAQIAGADLPAAWVAAAKDRSARLGIARATGALLSSMHSAGVVHPDLNAKNILVARSGDEAEAWLLDVDRVRFVRPGDRRAADMNLARLDRSLGKLRRMGAIDIDAESWEALQSVARAAAPPATANARGAH
ncbi:MAG: hypothetical protein IT356_08105 [Gemmatimonadaceae bacterium]|nr:hypothetical protein [Gemmatimonadaceae bacterium]